MPPSTEPSSSDIQSLQAKLGAGRFAEAEAASRALTDEFPSSPALHMILAVALTQQNKLDPAIDSYRAALRLNPAYVEALNNLGIVLGKCGRLDEAAQCYAQAYTLQPTNTDVLFNFGALLQLRGNDAEAVEAYKAILANSPDHFDALNNLAAVQSRLGHLDQAATHFSAASRLRPNDPLPLRNLGAVLNSQRKTDAAIAAFARSLDLAPGDRNTLNDLAALLESQERYGEAITMLEQSLAIDPNQPGALLRLGRMLGNAGRTAEGLALMRRAAALAPSDIKALGILARAEIDAGHQPTDLLNHIISLQTPRHVETAVKMWAALALNDPETAFSFQSRKLNSVPYKQLSDFYKNPHLQDQIAALPRIHGTLPEASSTPVIFTAADGKYAEIFAHDFITSARATMPDVSVHLHVMNAGAYDPAQALAAFPKARVTWTSEDIGPCDKTVYATRRFVRLAQFLATVDRTFIAVDIDAVFKKDVAGMVCARAPFDVITCDFAQEFVVHQLVNAGFVALAPTPGGRDFADFLASYILHFEQNGDAKWFLDQMALISGRTWISQHVPAIRFKLAPAHTVGCSAAWDGVSSVWTVRGDDKRRLTTRA